MQIVDIVVSNHRKKVHPGGVIKFVLVTRTWLMLSIYSKLGGKYIIVAVYLYYTITIDRRQV